jgi:hypothetical protein
MVRDAVIAVEHGPVLAAWVPAYEAIGAPSGSAFKVPAGANLTLRIRYKKNYNDEQKALDDRSVIGLYFTDAPLSGRSMDALSVKAPETSTTTFEPRTFGGTFATAARVVGLRPSFDDEYASMQVDAVAPNGRRIALLKLRRPQPQWYRRYWLAEPVEVPAGTRLEVTVTPATVDDMAPLFQKRFPLEVAVDYVAY